MKYFLESGRTANKKGCHMEKKTDRRIRKTKAQLRAGLSKLMQQKSIKEITVKELVEEVDINRSTFYLHYTDIYHMLETIENELRDEILKVIEEHPASPRENGGFPFIEDIFLILWENRDICSALLGSNGDMSFVRQIENIIAEHSLNMRVAADQKDEKDRSYSYAFCLTGCVGLIKAWLDSDDGETPHQMADLTSRLVTNALKGVQPV